jgi:hypothetical protein
MITATLTTMALVYALTRKLTLTVNVGALIVTLKMVRARAQKKNACCAW